MFRKYLIDLLGALLLSFPLGVVSFSLIRDGYLSDLHALFLVKTLLALDRGRLEMIGFSYPPLPLLVLLPWPTLFAPALWGALSIGGLAYLVFKDVWQNRQYFLLIFLLALLAAPTMVSIAVNEFSQAIGLFLLWAAWRQYVRWVEEGISVYGYYSGLLLGLAVYATPFALPLAILFALGLGLFRFSRWDAWVAEGLILAFPSVFGILIWGYLSWLFTGKIVFLYEALRGSTPSLAQVLSASPAYIAAGLIALQRPSARHLLFLTPLGLLLALPAMGFGYSLATGVALLSLFALGAMPRRVRFWSRWLFVLAGILQFLMAWETHPLTLPIPPRVLLEQAIGKTLSQAGPRRVLADDRTAFRLIAWAGTARPFLLPSDAGFELALSAPAFYADYVLVCPGQSPLSARYGERAPEGFILEWTFEECRFYRKHDAPPLTLR